MFRVTLINVFSQTDRMATNEMNAAERLQIIFAIRWKFNLLLVTENVRALRNVIGRGLIFRNQQKAANFSSFSVVRNLT